MAFNENTRVKIPAILHLCRLGYNYLSLSDVKWDETTNIFTGIFADCLRRLNEEITDDEIKRTYEDISLALDSEDLGQEFYRMITRRSGVKLIDFSSPEHFKKNNSFHVVTELPCKNGEEEFRPDITVLINGMPLAFIEVKKPNNREGILAERDRINSRFKNKKFRKFINISQILVFSNNMEYDSESIVPIQGSFYSTTSYEKADFSCFREDMDFPSVEPLEPENNERENFILRDNNLSSIKHSPEFLINKEPDTPTNRILTSLFSKDRIAMILKYGIAYLKGLTGLEKHIMRYPQFFATKAIERKLEIGIKKGIIWHTQGSGKTALAYFNVHYLTDYYQLKGIIPKFYFIVDRLDLMIQANREFASRGLVVHNVDSRDGLINDFRNQGVIHNLSGKREITVVNIQKFDNDPNPVRSGDYNLNGQRVYFLDEAHRSYNPKGNYLASLIESDRNAIMIALTGTPLIGKVRRSRDTFGDYIHKYFYNASIADGYTLKLIREGIESNYKIQLEEILKELEVQKGVIDKKSVYSHKRFVEPLLDYIITDFLKSRIRYGDHSIGGMVVCDSAPQAEELFEIFNRKYYDSSQAFETDGAILMAAEPSVEYYSNLKRQNQPLKASLILHDTGTKEFRKREVEDFKEGKIDLLFVYNMLLTGFDAKRLKKLYIARLIKDHNLLQTLTRVNRPYKDFRYGFVVDFADIRKAFDATNKAYFEELQMELGDDLKDYSNLFKSKEEIVEEINWIREKLFPYDLENAEEFSRQISLISDRKVVLEIKKALENARDLFNLIRMFGYYDLLNRVDFNKLNNLYNEISRHLELLNLKESLQNSIDTANLLNTALENVLFMFRKVSEDELIISDKLKDTLRKTREALGWNFDQKDPAFVSLYDELRRLFEKKNLDEISQEEMKNNIWLLQQIYDRVTELNRKNNLLKAKYEHDVKYARLHKRIIERGNITQREIELRDALLDIKRQADEKVLLNTKLINNEHYFEQMLINVVIKSFGDNHLPLTPDAARFINQCLLSEYMNEYLGNIAC